MLQAEGTEVNSKEMLAKSTFTEMDKNGDGKVKPANQRQRQKPQRKRDGQEWRWEGEDPTLAISSLHPCWPHAVTQLVGQRFKIAFERLSYDRAGDKSLFITYTR